MARSSTSKAKPKRTARKASPRAGCPRRLEVSSAEYHKLEYLSNSRLKLFADDPEEYAAVYVAKSRVQKPPTPSMQLGTDIETWLFKGTIRDVMLLPEEFEGPNGRKSEAFRAWKMTQRGKKVLTVEQAASDPHYRHYFEIAENLERHELANYLLYWPGVRVHDAIQWRDPTFGVERMCQLDLFRENESITDVKTARSILKDEWERDAYDLKYHWQAATYIDAVYELYGIDVPFYWIVIKNSPGYGVEVFKASEEQIETGRAEYRAALKRWVACRDSGNWRSPTFGLATEVGVPFYVSARGVEVIHKGKKFWVR